MLYSIEIKCLPKHLPETIEGDVSDLDVGEMLNVGKMAWPEGVAPTLGEDVVVALVAKTRVALSEEATEGEPGEGAEGDAPEGSAEEGGGAGEGGSD